MPGLVSSLVDVASIDRRDKAKETESFERVGQLIDTFRSSAIHNETLQAVMEDTMKPSPQNRKLRRNGKNDGPSYTRIMLTLLGYMLFYIYYVYILTSTIILDQKPMPLIDFVIVIK